MSAMIKGQSASFLSPMQQLLKASRPGVFAKQKNSRVVSFNYMTGFHGGLLTLEH